MSSRQWNRRESHSSGFSIKNLFTGPTTASIFRRFIDDSLLAKHIAFIHNGWFLLKSKGSGNEKMVLLFRITNEYGFENDIVKNGFADVFNLPGGTKMTFDKNTSSFHVNDKKGNYLFSLLFPKERQPSGYIVVPVLLWIIALVLTLLTISLIIRQIAETKSPLLGCLAALIVYSGIYLILLFVKEPGVFFETGLFSTYHFSLNSFIPSLGHLLLLSTLLAIMAWIFLRYLKLKIPYDRHVFLSGVALTLFFSAIAILFVICHNIFTNLVANSNINFEPFRVLDLTAYSLAGYVSVFFLFLVPLFILQRVLSESIRAEKIVITVSFAASILVFVAAGFPTDMKIWPLVIFYIALAVTMMLGLRRNLGKFNMTVIFSLYFGLYSLFYIINLSEKKSTENKKVMAVSYSSEHDPEAEDFLLDMWPVFSRDTVVKNVLSHDPVRQGDIDFLFRYLHDRYFNGYWGNFTMRLVTCGNDMPLQFSDETLVDNCFDFFRERFEKIGHQLTGTDFISSTTRVGDHIIWDNCFMICQMEKERALILSFTAMWMHFSQVIQNCS